MVNWADSAYPNTLPYLESIVLKVLCFQSSCEISCEVLETWNGSLFSNPFLILISIVYLYTWNVFWKVLMCTPQGQKRWLQQIEQSLVSASGLPNLQWVVFVPLPYNGPVWSLYFTAVATRGHHTEDCRLGTVAACAIIVALYPTNNIKTSRWIDPHWIYSFIVIILKCILFAYILCYFMFL